MREKKTRFRKEVFTPRDFSDLRNMSADEARAARRLVGVCLSGIADMRKKLDEVNSECARLYYSLGYPETASRKLATVSSALWDLIGNPKGRDQRKTVSFAIGRLTEVETDLLAYESLLPAETGPLEIERRFLLKSLPSSAIDLDPIWIKQVYVNDGKTRARFRKRTDANGHRYFRTVKKDVSHGVCVEEEAEIEPGEYLTAESNAERGLTKRRYEVMGPDGHLWEVDDLFGMVIAEVELDSIDAPLVIPDDIRDVSVMEITGMKQFTNYNLAR